MGAAAAGALMSGGVFANSEPLKVLIFGGTGFIGPHFVRVLREGGHKLTLFNRGKRNPGLFPDVETLIGDRNGQIDALKGRDWDVVIDDSGYLPAAGQAHDRPAQGSCRSTTSSSRASPLMRIYAAQASMKITRSPLSRTLTANKITDENYGA